MRPRRITRAIATGNAAAMGSRMGHSLMRAGVGDGSAVSPSPICVVNHDALRASFLAFEASTDRLPHMGDEEAYMDDGQGGSLWMRNCRACSSTICFHLRAEVAA